MLNGPECWLERGLAEARKADRPLALTVQLVGFQASQAWRLELLANSEGHLSLLPGVHLLVQLGQQGSPEPEVLGGGPLRVLFMAYSPKGVEPVLDFEAEEEALLHALHVEVAAGRVILEVVEDGSLAVLEERLRSNRYDVVHLSGHGELRAHGPELLMEDALGNLDRVGPERLFNALERGKSGPQGRVLPSLVVLASCETAAGNARAHSMAAGLIQRGVPAVIGWIRPVLDADATHAAADLYQRLAAGSPLALSLAFARRKLAELDQRRPMPAHGWSTLQLLCRTPGGLRFDIAAPVPAEDAYLPASEIYAHLQYAQVSVLERGFVGRRRPLQRVLQVLGQGRDPEAPQAEMSSPRPPLLGVVVVGMKGVGKSCLAARAVARYQQSHGGTRLLVLHGRLQGLLLHERLLSLAQAWLDNAAEAVLMRTDEPVEARFARLLRSHWSRREILIVLDDFEQNLSPTEAGRQGLMEEAEALLCALLPAMRGSRSKLLITTTGLFAWPAPIEGSLAEIELGSFGSIEVNKLWYRDQAPESPPAGHVSGGSPPAVASDLANLPLSHWQGLASRLGHNPRVLAWARALIGRRTPSAVQALLRSASANLPDLRNQPHSPEEQAKLASLFLRHAAIDQARSGLPLEVETFLLRARVHAEHVPARAFLPLCADLPAPPGPASDNPVSTWTAELLEPQLVHLANLGLLEYGSYQAQLPPERAYRVSPLVEPDLRAPDPETWHRAAARFYRSECISAPRKFSALLLRAWEHSLDGRDLETAEFCALRVNSLLHHAGFYLLNLELAERQAQNFQTSFPSILWHAIALTHCGKLHQASMEYVKADTLSRGENIHPSEQRSYLYFHAVLLRIVGDFRASREKLDLCIELLMGIPDSKDLTELATLFHERAIVRRAQEDYPGARLDIERSIELKVRAIGSEMHLEVAASLHEFAGILEAAGDLPAARHNLLKSIKIKRSVLGVEDHPHIAPSLHVLAVLDYREGKKSDAISGLRKVLEIEWTTFGSRDHTSIAETEWVLGCILIETSDGREEGWRLVQHALHVFVTQAPKHPLVGHMRERIKDMTAP